MKQPTPEDLDRSKKTMSVLVKILFLPITLLWLIWRKNKLSRSAKWGLTAAWLVICVMALIGSSEGPTSSPTTANEQPTVIANSQPTKKYIFDVPALVGLTYDEIVAQLGQPVGEGLTEQQLAAVGYMDDREFHKDDAVLLVTYNTKTGAVKELFLDTNDPSGATSNNQALLDEGNLESKSDEYSLEFVEARTKPGSYTGVVVTSK